MRALLREKPWYNRGEGIIHLLFPNMPQKVIYKVAVLAKRESILLSPRSSGLLASVPIGTDVMHMLSFPPLLEALQEFCQKALCSEVSTHAALLSPCELVRKLGVCVL